MSKLRNLWYGLALSLVVSACGATINGKSYGGPGASSSPSSSSSSSSVCRAPSGRTTTEQPPPLSAPANPWLAVAGERPAALLTSDRARVTARQDVSQCDAAHDHCLRDCTWLVEWESISGAKQSRTAARRTVVASHWMTAGKFEVSGNPYRTTNVNEDSDYIAYRTVPATRRLLRDGALVVVPEHEPKDPVPSSERAALGSWTLGRLGDVDWNAGELYLQRDATPYPLSTARVVVLTYPRGGKVALAEGFTKDEIVVKAGEVILPRTEAE